MCIRDRYMGNPQPSSVTCSFHEDTLVEESKTLYPHWMGSRRRFTHISPREISAIGEGSETTREWGGNTLRYSPAPGKPVQLDKAYFEHDQSSFLKANRDNSKLARADWSHRITKMSAWCMTCSSAVSLRWLGDHSAASNPTEVGGH